MSNPKDPKKPNPVQPDPNAPPQPGAPEPGYQSGSPSFEFQLPDEVDSYSELPPIPTPDGGSQSDFDPLPPPPEAGRRTGVSFDFINVSSRGSFGDFGMDPLPLPPEPQEEPAVLPPEDVLLVPELPAVPAAGDSALFLEATVPPLEPVEPVAELPEIPVAPADAVFDLAVTSDMYLPEVPVAGDSSIGLAEALPLPDELPLAEAAPSSVITGSGKPVSSGSIPDLGSVLPLPEPPGVSDSEVNLDELIPTADSSSFTLGSVEPPLAEAAPSSVKIEPVKPGSSGSVPDIGALRFPAPPTPAAPPASKGSTPSLPTAPPASKGSTPSLPTAPPAPAYQGSPSFEFQLPDEVDSYSELPPIPTPDGGSQSDFDALPPRPEAGQRTGVSFDFINVGSRSFAEIDFAGKVIDPVETPQPPAPPAAPVADSKVGLGNLEPVEPASGWLDETPAAPPPAAPVANPFGAPIAEVAESSDIFAGTSVRPAEPVETSDVISATSGHPLPADPVRTSDIALTFNDPVGGSTAQDSDLSDLPVAEDVADSGTALLGGAGEGESIHDEPGPVSENPLFDSATLADAPELPAAAVADATDYGAAPDHSADASSILADLSGPDRDADEDSSSVRVEAPGVNRTLTGGPSNAMFELTVSDEPLPAELQGASDDGTMTESTDWQDQDQSGSDLLAQRRTAPDGDTDGLVEPVDADLLGDQPSLSSAPSSIHSGGKRPAGSGSSDSANAEVGTYAADVDEDLAEAAEFTDHPELGATIAHPPAGAPPKRVPYLSSADFDLPEFPAGEEGGVDFDATTPSDEENVTRGIARDELNALLPDDSDELPTRGTKPRTPVPADEPDEPVVSVDWLAGSTEGSALAEPVKTKPTPPKEKEKEKDKKKGKSAVPAESTAKTKPTKVAPRSLSGSGTATATAEREKPAKKGGGLLVGALVGALVAGGAFAGVYFGGVIPNSEKTTAQVPPGTQPGTSKVPPAAGGVDAQLAFAGGETAKALEQVKANPPTNTAEKATAGYIGVFAKVQSAQEGAVVAADDAELVAARANLQAVIDDDAARAEPGGAKRAVKAAVALGVSHEVTGDTKAARKVYTDAMAKYPEYKATFEALLDKLDALEAPAAPGVSRRLTPADAERLLLSVTLLLQDGPKAEDPEPGVYYWKAVKLADAGKYKEAVEQIELAKKAHVARARAVAGRGVNPLSDPLEQIFTKSCDELKAYWLLRGAVYGNPALAATIKSEGGLAKALDKLLSAEKDVKDALAKVDKAEKQVTAAQVTVTKLEGEVAKLTKEVKAAEVGKTEAEKKLEAETIALKAAEKKLETAVAELGVAEKDAKAQKDVLAALVEELKPVTKIPDKWGPADLIAATKAVASRATGPDLKTLVPNTIGAIGGGGLSTAQLLQIADRLTKAEATAKDATAKLAAESKRLADKYATDTKALTDAHAETVKKLKDGSAEELKKATDKFAADAKKLTDEYTDATAKLKDAHAVALATEQAKTDAEKKRALARELEFQKQLAGAVTPGQVMDIWLPTLTDLRRASDSAPALAAAEKAIAGSSADSEDAAKARTVAGLAYLIRGDLATAKDYFQAARRSPAYKLAAGKPWAVAADNGLDAVTDPVAPYRLPVVIPPVDTKAAAASLNAGIGAYRSGRYDDAVKALLDATKNNPADPVAWYFLGAARWAQGDEEQAKKDFAQGAEREKVSTVSNRTLSGALAPIQGTIRDVIDRTRP